MIRVLVKNFFSLLLFNIIDKIAFAVLFIVIARSLSTSDFGAYNLVITMLFIGGMLVNFGIESALIREVAQDRTRTTALFYNALVLTTAMAAILWPLLVYLSHLLQYAASIPALLGFGGLIFFFTGAAQVSSGIIKAHERIELFALIAAGQSLANLALGIIVLSMGGGITGLVCAMVSTEALKAICLLLVVRRLFAREPFYLDRTILASTLKMSFPFALIMVYALVLDRINILLLGRFKTLDDVAVYAVVSKIADFLSLFSTSLIGALYPALSARIAADARACWDLYRNSISGFAILGFGISAFVVILAHPIITFVFGGVYGAGSTALRLMGLIFLLTMLSGPVGLLLLATADQMFRVVGICMIVLISNIILSLWLIPPLNYTGAAMATLISIAIGFVGRLIISKMHFGRLPDYPLLVWRPLVAGIITGLVLLLLRQQHLLVLLFMGCCTYGAALHFLGEFRQPQYAPAFNKLRMLVRR